MLPLTATQRYKTRILFDSSVASGRHCRILHRRVWNHMVTCLIYRSKLQFTLCIWQCRVVWLNRRALQQQTLESMCFCRLIVLSWSLWFGYGNALQLIAFIITWYGWLIWLKCVITSAFDLDDHIIILQLVAVTVSCYSWSLRIWHVNISSCNKWCVTSYYGHFTWTCYHARKRKSMNACLCTCASHMLKCLLATCLPLLFFSFDKRREIVIEPAPVFVCVALCVCGGWRRDRARAGVVCQAEPDF